jgi:hypothetical protein
MIVLGVIPIHVDKSTNHLRSIHARTIMRWEQYYPKIRVKVVVDSKAGLLRIDSQ